MNTSIELSAILIEVNDIQDKNAELAINIDNRITTKQNYELEANSISLPSFLRSRTILQNRLIKLNLAINKTQPLNALYIEQLIKNLLVALYFSLGYTEPNITEAIDKSLEANTEKTADIFVATVYSYLSASSMQLALTNLVPLANSNNTETKNKDLLINQIQDELAIISNKLPEHLNYYAEIEINKEIQSCYDSNIKDLELTEKNIKARSKLVDSDINLLVEKYENLFLNKNELYSIFAFLRDIQSFISIGLSKNTAYYLVINIVNHISTMDNYNNEIKKFITNYPSLKILIDDSYTKLDKNIKIYLDKDSFQIECCCLFILGFEQQQAVNQKIQQAHLAYSAVVSSDKTPNHSSQDETELAYKIAVCESNLHNETPINSVINRDNINLDISLSPMYNYGNTCWFNSSIKFICNYYGKKEIQCKINKSLIESNQVESTPLQQQYTNLLKVLKNFFDDLATDKPINIQIDALLTEFYQYAIMLKQEEIVNDEIDTIYSLMQRGFNEENGKIQVNLAYLQQETASDFITALVYFLGLNNDSNQLQLQTIMTSTFNTPALKLINENIKEDILIFETKFPIMDTKTTNKIPIKDDTVESNSINLSDFRERVFNSTIKSGFSIDQLTTILHNAYDLKIDVNTKIPYHSTLENKFIANISKLSNFHLDVTHSVALFDKSYIRDFYQIKAELKKMLPSIEIMVIDKNTNKQYKIQAIPQTMILYLGAGGNNNNIGHYMSVSLADNGAIIIHNDIFIQTIEDCYMQRVNNMQQLNTFKQKNTADKLLEFIELSGAYPTDIGFKVISATEVNDNIITNI